MKSEEKLENKVSSWDNFPDCEIENPPKEDPDCPLEMVGLYIQKDLDEMREKGYQMLRELRYLWK